MKAFALFLLYVVVCSVIAVVSPWLYAAIALAWMTRLVVTASTRRAFLEDPDFPASYHALPSLDAMLFHPKYWTLWTVAHWRAWVARQLAQKAGAA